jgi:hypothetical protein
MAINGHDQDRRVSPLVEKLKAQQIKMAGLHQDEEIRRTPEPIPDFLDIKNPDAKEVDPPKRKRGPYKKRPKKPLIDEEALRVRMADLNDLGHLYSKMSRVVAECEGLSAGATSTYTYMDSRCFDGRFDDDRVIDPPSYMCRMTQSELAQRFGVDRHTASTWIAELRRAGFLWRDQIRKGVKTHNTYTLVPRMKRLAWEAEQRQRRLDKRAKKPPVQDAE